MIVALQCHYPLCELSCVLQLVAQPQYVQLFYNGFVSVIGTSSFSVRYQQKNNRRKCCFFAEQPSDDPFTAWFSPRIPSVLFIPRLLAESDPSVAATESAPWLLHVTTQASLLCHFHQVHADTRLVSFLTPANKATVWSSCNEWAASSASRVSSKLWPTERIKSKERKKKSESFLSFHIK